MNVGMDASMVTGVGEELRGGELLAKGGEELLSHGGEDAIEKGAAVAESCGLSFTYLTVVATARGEQAIGSLKPGQAVWAYNPQTKKMELEPIMHVWINHDNDLEDLTLVTTVPAKNGKPAQQVYETIHTNKKHPFLTQEYGFLPVSALHVGMHIVKADGTMGEVFAWTLVPGVSVMYNLEVHQDHTFTVGDGQWVVHNSNCGNVIASITDRARKNGVKAIGEDGVAKFEEAMQKGLVGPYGENGIKKLSGTYEGFTHEIKIAKGPLAKWRFYGSKIDGEYIFSKFGKHT